MSSIKKQLDQFWTTLSDKEKNLIRQTGVNWLHPRTTVNQKIAALQALSDRLKDDNKWIRKTEHEQAITDKILDRMEGITGVF